MKPLLITAGMLTLAALAACNNPEAVLAPVEGASASPAPSAAPIGTTPPAASPPVAPSMALRDDFDGDKVNTDLWKAFEQTGVIAARQGTLEILNAGTQPDFPYLVTRNEIIPPTGPFFFEISYKLVTSGKNVAFCLDYLPATVPGEESLTEPFMRTEATDTQMKVLFDLETSDYTSTIEAGFASDAFHTLRLEADGKNNYRLLHNAKEVGVFTSTRRPKKFWIGAYPQTNQRPGVWPRITLEHVAAGPL